MKINIYDTKTAIEYMKANPYKNVLKRASDERNYTYDQDGTPRVNLGMWVSIDKMFNEDDEWMLPNICNKKVNDIYKNKNNGTLYVLTKIIDNTESLYLNLEDKYPYTCPDNHMELWYDSI